MNIPILNEIELIKELELLKAQNELRRQWHNKNMNKYYNKPDKKEIILQRARDKYNNNLDYQSEVKRKRRERYLKNKLLIKKVLINEL